MTESLLKMKKNAFYFILKALFAVKIFRFLSGLFGHAGKATRLESNVNLEVHDFTPWFRNNFNIVQYLTKQKQSDNEIWFIDRI